MSLLTVDTLFTIYSFLEKDKPFVFFLATNKAHNELKHKFRYDKSTLICDTGKWNSLTISYFPNIVWRVLANNVKQIRGVPKHCNALQINYTRVLRAGNIPSHVTKFYFCANYDRPVTKGVIPNTVTHLEIGEKCIWLTNPDMLPDSLETLVLNGYAPLQSRKLPNSLKKLVLNGRFFNSYDLQIIPSSLEFGEHCDVSLHFYYTKGSSGIDVMHPLHKTKIKKLILSEKFDVPLFSSNLPENLVWLKFGKYFNQEIHIDVLPETLRHIEFGKSYNQKVYLDFIPKSIETVVVRNTYMYEYFHQYDLWFECIYKP